MVSKLVGLGLKKPALSTAGKPTAEEPQIVRDLQNHYGYKFGVENFINNIKTIKDIHAQAAQKEKKPFVNPKTAKLKWQARARAIRRKNSPFRRG